MKQKIILLLTAILLSSITMSATSGASSKELRGIWISYIDYEDAGLYDKNESQFRANADDMFRKVHLYGFNTVYFQVRPYNDAIYPSDHFKWCKYLAPSKPDYDPLEILVEKAHKYNLSFHAWINPYRLTTEKILNPASSKTTRHIVNGVKEIIEYYDVDGIHFDDYFYPSKTRGKQYYSVSVNKRKANVNKMIRTVYKTIKKYNPDLIFGISPAGNTEYSESIGCDLETWVRKDGYIDYIIPQLYWSDDYIMERHNTKFYSDTLDEWTDLIDGRKDTYIGLALYKSGLKSNTDRGWRKTSHNIASQVKLESDYACDGYVMFSYRYIFTKDGRKEFANYIKYLSGLKASKPIITIKRGKSYNLYNAFTIKDKYDKYLTFSSDSPKTATVSESGIVHAKKRGLAYISVKGLAKSRITFRVKIK